MTLDVQSFACGDRDVCEKGGELIQPNYTLENLLYWGNINSLVLTYALGVSVLTDIVVFDYTSFPIFKTHVCAVPRSAC